MTDSPRTGLRPLTGAVVGVVALLLGVGATLLFVGLRGDASPSRAGELLIVSAETAEVVGTSGDYSLALSDVDPQTLWFTDRPQRLSGVMSTNTLLEQWPQYFASSRPNAALTFQSPTGPEGQSTPIPVELGVPTQQDGTVRFPIQGLAGATLPVDRGALEGPRLFIDPPAARLTDFHESPMLVPSIPQIPDVGGPTPPRSRRRVSTSADCQRPRSATNSSWSAHRRASSQPPRRVQAAFPPRNEGLRLEQVVAGGACAWATRTWDSSGNPRRRNVAV